jgi:hypothetical protein
MRRSSLGWLGAGLGLAGALGAPAFTACSSRSGTGGYTGGTAGTGASTGGESVLQHHKNPTRDGVYAEPTLTRNAAAGMHLDPTFHGKTQGATYAQPLYLDGGPGGTDLIFVVTEEDRVFALDAATGATVWTKQVAQPVPLAQLPCGNIDPLGITGTPVIDPTSRTLYFDAMTTPDGGATKRHLIFGLSVDDGAVQPGFPVDVSATAKSGSRSLKSAFQNQRGALAIVDGTLYVPYGGHYGDCGDYHGWLVGVSLADPSKVRAWATPAAAGGSWAPGGVASDGTSLFIATGNTLGASTWGGGEAILRFGAGPSFSGETTDFFAPSNWIELDDGDVDIGGSGPVLFDLPASTPSKVVISLGKDGNAYLLDRTNLGGVSDAVASTQVSHGEIINAAAAYTSDQATYVIFNSGQANCPNGDGDLGAIRVKPGSPPSLEVAWCASQNGVASPMVTTTDGHAESIVWGIGAEGDGRLRGFDGDTGATVFGGGGSGDVMGPLRRFNTPIAAKGRIFVAGDDAVYAFTP